MIASSVCQLSLANPPAAPPNFSEINKKIANLIQQHYVDKGRTNVLIQHFRHAPCIQSSTVKDFVQCTNTAIATITHDPHLQLWFYPKNDAPSRHQSMHEFLISLPYAQANANFGFVRVEILKNNIGLLVMNFFPPREVGQATLDAAMQFLKHTDGLLIDLRNNIGGDPRMVPYLASYLLPKRPILLNTIQWSASQSAEKFFSFSHQPVWRYIDKPVYVLVSPTTFSAAEEFTYDLQQLHRVTVVGEPTAGGANPGELFPISRQLALYLPIGMSINPYTKSNWEKTGVQPNLVVSSHCALVCAYTHVIHFLNGSSGCIKPCR